MIRILILLSALAGSATCVAAGVASSMQFGMAQNDYIPAKTLDRLFAKASAVWGFSTASLWLDYNDHILEIEKSGQYSYWLYHRDGGALTVLLESEV